MPKDAVGLCMAYGLRRNLILHQFCNNRSSASASCRQQLDTVLSVSCRQQLDTVYQQILVATKFGVYQMKNM